MLDICAEFLSKAGVFYKVIKDHEDTSLKGLLNSIAYSLKTLPSEIVEKLPLSQQILDMHTFAKVVPSNNVSTASGQLKYISSVVKVAEKCFGTKLIPEQCSSQLVIVYHLFLLIELFQSK